MVPMQEIESRHEHDCTIRACRDVPNLIEHIDAFASDLRESQATIDAQATEIAALKEALEELRQVYHHVVHRGELDECELLLCQRARRVLAGKGAQGA